MVHRTAIGRCIGGIANNRYRRRCPLIKRIGVLRCIVFLGSLVRRYDTILNGCGTYQRVVVIQPSNGVAVLGLRIGSLIGGISSNGYRRNIPTGEGIGPLGGCCLGRIGMGRHDTVLNSSLVYQRIVVVQPRNGVAVLGLRIGSLIGGILCSGYRSNIPTGEGIGPLSGCCLGRKGMCRHYAVHYRCLAYQRIVVIQPRNGERLLRRSKGRLIGGSTSYSHYLRTPTGKGVEIFLIGRLGRGGMGRHDAVLDVRGAYQRIVLI